MEAGASSSVVRDAEEMEGLGLWSVPTAKVSLAFQRKQEGFLSGGVVLRDREALERDRVEPRAQHLQTSPQLNSGTGCPESCRFSDALFLL